VGRDPHPNGEQLERDLLDGSLPFFTLKGRREDPENNAAAMSLWKQIMRGRSLRALAVWSLIAVQSQLLWFGEFHRHGEEPSGAESPAILRRAFRLRNDLTPKPVCLACQISLRNAASPQSAFVAKALEACNFCRPVPPAQQRPVQSLVVVSSRAPPVI
jgi:hypothetical protein